MAVAAILNYNFVMLDHPRSPFVHLKFSFKFVLILCVFSRYRDSKISQTWLKKPIQAPKIMFLGSFDPQTLFFIIETLKRLYLTQKHAL